MKIYFNNYRIFVFFAIILAFCGLIYADGINFGPIQAINKKIDEYKEKKEKEYSERQWQYYPNYQWVTLDSSLSGSYGNYYYYYRLAAANSPYTVDGDVSFSSYNKLLIEPGVTIKFSGYYSFNASGSSITIVGTASQPIKFTSGRVSPSAGDYSYIFFDYSSSSDYMELNYVTFEYGSGVTIGGGSSAKVSNCTFESTNNHSPNLYLNGTVTHCDFKKNSGTYDVSIIGSPTISYCNISGEIYSSYGAGQYKINNCNLTRGAAHVVDNSANWTLDFENNWWGTTNTITIDSYIDCKAGTINYTPILTSSETTAGPQ